jgi:hypothetical protein
MLKMARELDEALFGNVGAYPYQTLVQYVQSGESFTYCVNAPEYTLRFEYRSTRWSSESTKAELFLPNGKSWRDTDTYERVKTEVVSRVWIRDGRCISHDPKYRDMSPNTRLPISV